jgi:phosphoglycerol transferase MdoB-like AlkP superfamily enzyme
MQDAIAQQIDIMPTVLNYLGYDRPYVAFGKDILHTSPEKTWAVNYINGIYQYIKGTYLLQWDGNKTTALYDFRKDSMLTHNLANKVPEQAAMERELKAIIQSYMTRMSTNNLTVKE